MESHKNFDQVRLCTRNKPTMFPVIFVYFYGKIVYEDFALLIYRTTYLGTANGFAKIEIFFFK